MLYFIEGWEEEKESEKEYKESLKGEGNNNWNSLLEKASII